MSNNNTASFLIRFTQKFWKDDKGTSQIQWRGNIKYVQGGEEHQFTEFDDAVAFIQQNLTNLTLDNIQEETEKDSILLKSFNIWKKFTTESTQRMISTIKDPRGQLDALKTQVNDVVEQKLKTNTWLPSTRSDNQDILDGLQNITSKLETLDNRLKRLEKLAKS